MWEDAVVQALRWGWIDSVVQRIDADAVRQRWTPRKPASTWSLINVAAAQRLIEQGLMESSGLAAFQARRSDRQGIYAYEQASVEWTAEHEDALAANPAAARFWAMATASYRKGPSTGWSRRSGHRPARSAWRRWCPTARLAG